MAKIRLRERVRASGRARERGQSEAGRGRTCAVSVRDGEHARTKDRQRDGEGDRARGRERQPAARAPAARAPAMRPSGPAIRGKDRITNGSTVRIRTGRPSGRTVSRQNRLGSGDAAVRRLGRPSGGATPSGPSCGRRHKTSASSANERKRAHHAEPGRRPVPRGRQGEGRLREAPGLRARTAGRCHESRGGSLPTAAGLPQPPEPGRRPPRCRQADRWAAGAFFFRVATAALFSPCGIGLSTMSTEQLCFLLQPRTALQ